MHPEIRISEDKSIFSLEASHGIWSSILGEDGREPGSAPDYVDMIMPAGTHGFFALDGQSVVGYANVFSDGVAKAWIADFAVRRDRQRQGIGSALISAIDRRFAAIELSVDAIKPSETLFRKMGIDPSSNLVACARQGRGNSLWPEYAISAMGLRLSQDPSSIDRQEFHDLLATCGFTRIANDAGVRSDTVRLFGPTVFGFFVHDGAELIGFARIFSNQSNIAWLSELCVKENRRGQGIGNALLSEVNNRFLYQHFYAAVPNQLADFFHSRHVRRQGKVVPCRRPPIKGH